MGRDKDWDGDSAAQIPINGDPLTWLRIPDCPQHAVSRWGKLLSSKPLDHAAL